MESEFLDQVRADVSAYLKTSTTLGKLQIVSGGSRVFGFFLLLLTIILLVFGLAAFCGVAAVVGLASYMPLWAAALIMGGVFVVIIGIVILFRKQLFINPFVKLLSGILFEEEGKKIEEERLRKEAEND